MGWSSGESEDEAGGLVAVSLDAAPDKAEDTALLEQAKEAADFFKTMMVRLIR